MNNLELNYNIGRRFQVLNNNVLYRFGAVIALVLAFFVFAPVVSEANNSFKDVSKSNDHYDSIMSMTNRGAISGYPDGTFRPENPVNRGQVAVMLSRGLGLQYPENLNKVLSVYSDVNSKSDYAAQIAAVTDAGIFSGGAGKFNPRNNMTREQMATVLVKSFNLQNYNLREMNVDINLNNVSPSHRENVQILANLGITKVNKQKNFMPGNRVTRGQFATFLSKAIDVTENPPFKEIGGTFTGDYPFEIIITPEERAMITFDKAVTKGDLIGSITSIYDFYNLIDVNSAEGNIVPNHEGNRLVMFFTGPGGVDYGLYPWTEIDITIENTNDGSIDGKYKVTFDEFLVPTVNKY